MSLFSEGGGQHGLGARQTPSKHRSEIEAERGLGVLTVWRSSVQTRPFITGTS